MPLEDVRSLVNGEGFLVLGTIGPDGSLTAEMVPCRADNEILTFTVGTDSASYANILHEDRVCAVVENAAREFYRMRSVTIHGRATLLGSESDDGRATFTAPLDDVVSFDFSKIQVKH